jgi:hypothetical protein
MEVCSLLPPSIVLQVLGRAMGGEIQASNMENEVKLSILR